MGLALLVVLLPVGCGRNRAAEPATLAVSAPSAPLQEVAPPPGVQQLAAALADHSPQLKILAPSDGATLPDGPWSVRLQVNDWPLAETGELGLGAHVVVQLDDEPPQRLALTSGPSTDELSVEMAPLRPGSHRLTVYAARPWGEAVKQPGAFRQIQLQRVAPTPLRVPAPGTPQLIAVSPGSAPQAEPVLLDWLLLDSPLQGLREGDDSWRLRVSVNGDSFLVDQNTPLWLKGWRRGSNTLQLDLVDGRGEPLNPPFNSLVSEVTIDAGAARPAWLNRLEPAALAQLLGQAPAPPEPSVAAEAPAEPETTPAPEANPEPEREAEPAAAPAPTPEPDQPLTPEPIASSSSRTTPQPEPEPTEPDPQPLEPMQPQAIPAPEPEPEPEPQSSPAEPAPTPAAASSPAPLTDVERVGPSTRLSGSAREQVRDDGSLIKPRGQGPLSGLRERFGS